MIGNQSQQQNCFARNVIFSNPRCQLLGTFERPGRPWALLGVRASNDEALAICAPKRSLEIFYGDAMQGSH